ncbi:MAG: transposase [Bacteroidetes bacterium]|nr:transposase [Bacteroidota bacterium]
MQRRKYSNEFKQEAVQLASGPGANLSQVARDLGINAGMLGRWRTELETLGKTAFRGKGVARDEEMASLKRELARIKRERDFLKDAAAL